MHSPFIFINVDVRISRVFSGIPHTYLSYYPSPQFYDISKVSFTASSNTFYIPTFFSLCLGIRKNVELSDERILGV